MILSSNVKGTQYIPIGCVTGLSIRIVHKDPPFSVFVKKLESFCVFEREITLGALYVPVVSLAGTLIGHLTRYLTT